MSKTDEFKRYAEEHPPNKKQSKLQPFLEGMLDMRRLGYTFREIVLALKRVDVEAYPSEIKRYLDRTIKVKPKDLVENISQKQNKKNITFSILDSEPKG